MRTLSRSIAAFLGAAALVVATSVCFSAGEADPEGNASSDIAAKAYHMRLDGHVDEAKRTLEGALNKAPDDAAAWLELARLELQRAGTTRDLSEGQKAIEKAIELRPDDPVYHRWAAYIAMINGILQHDDRARLKEQCRKAVSAAERAVSLDADDHEARRLLVSLYGNNPPDLGGDEARARRQVEELEERSPVDGAAARCEFALKDEPATKLSLWKELATKAPDDARVHEHLALTYAWSGDVENATRHADRTLELDSSRVRVLLDVARAFALEKQPEPANRFLRRYLELEPPPPLALRAWAHMALGQILRMSGDAETATRELRKAKELDPYCWFTMTPPAEELFTPPER